MEIEFPLAAELVVPHRPPMLLIDSLVRAGEYEAETSATVARDGLFTDGKGLLDPVALLEMMAQTVAALGGYLGLEGGAAPKRGWLVAVRSFSFSAEVRAGDELRIMVRRTDVLEGFELGLGEVWRGETLVAAADLRVWAP